MATAIDDAFARWDRAHLHQFWLPDGQRVTRPSEWDDFDDDEGMALDDRQVKIGKRDLWTVAARGDDAQRANQSVVRLPAGYVTDHVELGYATTAHRAQGMTVDATFAILRPGMSRELAYVAMTRGRTENHAFIATDTPDLSYDGAPPRSRPVAT